MEKVGAEYSDLSFRAGWFAGQADRHLGTREFGMKVRVDRWSLTEAKLDAWKAEAMALGVPAEKLVPVFDYSSEVEQARAMQERLDQSLASTASK